MLMHMSLTIIKYNNICNKNDVPQTQHGTFKPLTSQLVLYAKMDTESSCNV